MKRYLNILFVLMLAPLIFACDSDNDDIGFTQIRVVHGSADAPPVDVLVDDGVAFGDVEFKESTDYAPLVASTYNIKIVPTGKTDPVLFGENIALSIKTKYTAIALGPLTVPLDVLLVTDNTDRMEDMAQVRLIHGSTFANINAANGVDIYVTEPAVTDVSGTTPLLTAFKFKDVSDFVPLPAGQYRVSLTPTGSTTVVFTVEVALENDYIYNAIASDADAQFSAPSVILLSDKYSDIY
jgi:trimeric autotransporter adhesin